MDILIKKKKTYGLFLIKNIKFKTTFMGHHYYNLWKNNGIIKPTFECGL